MDRRNFPVRCLSVHRTIRNRKEYDSKKKGKKSDVDLRDVKSGPNTESSAEKKTTELIAVRAKKRRRSDRQYAALGLAKRG